MNQQQQGDVLIRRVKSIPGKAKRIMPRNGRLVLVEGEHTGHAHVITTCEREGDVELYEMDKDMFLKCLSSVTVQHEEHATQVIEPGIYTIERVREHDYVSGMVSPVRD